MHGVDGRASVDFFPSKFVCVIAQQAPPLSGTDGVGMAILAMMAIHDFE